MRPETEPFTHQRKVQNIGNRLSDSDYRIIATAPNLSLLNGDITSEEVLKVITKLKNNKVPGEDGLPGELY